MAHFLKKEYELFGPWWWSSGHCARLLFRRTEFESVWTCLKRIKITKRGRGWPILTRYASSRYLFPSRYYQLGQRPIPILWSKLCYLIWMILRDLNKRLQQEGSVQWDQMAKSFKNIWPFATMQTCPITSYFCQSRNQNFPKTKLTLNFFGQEY